MVPIVNDMKITLSAGVVVQSDAIELHAIGLHAFSTADMATHILRLSTDTGPCTHFRLISHTPACSPVLFSSSPGGVLQHNIKPSLVNIAPPTCDRHRVGAMPRLVVHARYETVGVPSPRLLFYQNWYPS